MYILNRKHLSTVHEKLTIVYFGTEGLIKTKHSFICGANLASYAHFMNRDEK